MENQDNLNLKINILTRLILEQSTNHVFENDMWFSTKHYGDEYDCHFLIDENIVLYVYPVNDNGTRIEHETAIWTLADEYMSKSLLKRKKELKKESGMITIDVEEGNFLIDKDDGNIYVVFEKDGDLTLFKNGFKPKPLINTEYNHEVIGFKKLDEVVEVLVFYNDYNDETMYYCKHDKFLSSQQTLDEVISLSIRNHLKTKVENITWRNYLETKYNLP